MSSRLVVIQWNTRGVRKKERKKPHIPLISVHFPSLYLYKHVSTNIISVQCHYCETAAGNVSPASVTHSSTRVLTLHPLPLQKQTFGALIGRYKLQVITTRFFTASTIGIYSSGFLFKLFAGESQSPAAYFPTISCTSALPPQIQQFHIQH